MKESILVAVDGSMNSLEALEYAVESAKWSESKIIVVNIQPSYNMIHTRLLIKEEQIKDFQRELFEEATNAADKYLQDQKMDYELVLKIGDPAQQICQLAKELHVRYIALGSRGMGKLKGAILGSVSNGVIHQSEVPIVIIPQKKQEHDIQKIL